MRVTLKSLLAATMTLLAGINFAQAKAVYTYQGNPFDAFTHELPCGTNAYCSVVDGANDENRFLGKGIRGSFSVSTALDDGTYKFDNTSKNFGYSFTDDVYIYETGSNILRFEIRVVGGEIDQWAIFFATGSPNIALPQTWLLTQRILDQGTADGSNLFTTTCMGVMYEPRCVEVGATHRNPGTWTMRHGAPVPEPATLPLFAIALAGLVASRRQVFRAAA